MKMMYYLSIQDSSSYSMSNITIFYDHVMVILIFIMSIVMYSSMMIFFIPCFERYQKGNEILEGLWTILPCIVLGSLALPSLVTLYLSDETSSIDLTIKVSGYQWYWTYQIENMDTFSSYFIPTDNLSIGSPRLLEVDSKLSVPLNLNIRILTTSNDVIHSWTIPSMGVKMDAVPGRLNQMFILPTKMGIFYGQCSEICGALHSFMPICLQVF